LQPPVLCIRGGLAGRGQRGDERAFRELVQPRRAELQAHCYRMLRSVQDTQNVLQEALVWVRRGLGRFQGRSSLRVSMYRW
jgi:DNA-directed RNA polymerase specialized sigma24 family protein